MHRFIFVLGLLAIPSSVSADRPSFHPLSRCFPLDGLIDVAWQTEGCDSPLGCTAGRIHGAPLLSGATTRYTVHAGGPTPDDPTAEIAMAYTGRLVVTTKRGTLTVDDMGLIDKGTGLVSSQSRTITGTGKFTGATGAFFTFGRATADGFTSRLGGKLCFPPQR